MPKKFFVYTLPLILHRVLPSSLLMTIPFSELKGNKWIVGSGNFRMLLGKHENEATKILSQILKEGAVFYDVGAHVGYYSLLASKIVRESGRVVAFEPNPRNVAFLKKHIFYNNCKNVTVIEACVGNRIGTVYFDYTSDSLTGHVNSVGNLTAKMVNLDSLIKTEITPVPDVIKIDVEGAELLLLEGAIDLLAHKHPTILLSTHNQELYFGCRRLLERVGYGIVDARNNFLSATGEILATHRSFVS